MKFYCNLDPEIFVMRQNNKIGKIYARGLTRSRKKAIVNPFLVECKFLRNLCDQDLRFELSRSN